MTESSHSMPNSKSFQDESVSISISRQLCLIEQSFDRIEATVKRIEEAQSEHSERFKKILVLLDEVSGAIHE